MKISSINLQKYTTLINKTQNSNLKQEKSEIKQQNPIIQNFNDFNLNFIGTRRKSLNDYSKQTDILKSMTPESDMIYQTAQKLAKMAHSPEVETWHLFCAELIEFKRYIKKVENREINPENETRFKTAISIPEAIYPNCNIWRNDELRKDVLKVINKHLTDFKTNFIEKDKEKYPRPPFKTPTLSSKAINDLTETWDMLNEEFENNVYFQDNFFFVGAGMSRDTKLNKKIDEFIIDLQKAAMTQKAGGKNKHHIEFYDKKADAIWKNIAHGNNVIVLSDLDNSSSYSYLQDSFVNLINKPGNKYGSLDPEKTEVITLNDKATFDFVENLTRKIQLDKNKKATTTVIMGDLISLFKNCGGQASMSSLNLIANSGKKNSNQGSIRFVFSASPEFFHVNTQTQSNPVTQFLLNHAQQSLPILSGSDTKEYLTNKSGQAFVKAKIGREISKDAILKAIELTSSKDGNYPEKTMHLLNSTAKYFIDEKEITPEHIETYLKETEHLSETTAGEEKSIILDTGKKIFDIKGMPMTVAQAESIVKQIKKGIVGTRGFVIQHNSKGAYGGGRRHTAEAIAGEAQIPMLVINAKDFALKDIDALSQQASLSEAKIKKIISNAKAQAEANKLNTAMIYIENFDNFASNPLYGISSIYEQKAFTQLMSEMDNVRKEGKVNLVVVGSMNMPETLDENVMKPYKFLDQIEVYQPVDPAQRREVLEYYIDKNDIKIAGKTKQERDEILNNISETTQYFSIVDLMYMLDVAKNVSQERDKDAIDKADFIEAYLQTTSGRPNPAYISDTKKRIVTSHEAGHALTLKIMYEIAQKQDILWHLPSKVNFITLDPRGDFGGAMYPKESENEEWSFEKIMSDIICDYGGHSTENLIYNMQGSYGITMDMESASNMAHYAVMNMGMGAHTGVKYTPCDGFVSEAKKELVEKDVDMILATAKEISDSIIKEYKDFIIEFTEKYYSKVATGECIIPSDEFEALLDDWRSRQTPEKMTKLEVLEANIIGKIASCKEKK